MYEESRFTVYRFEKSGATLSSKSDIAVYEESGYTVYEKSGTTVSSKSDIAVYEESRNTVYEKSGVTLS